MMLVLVRKATPQEITQMAAYYDGYIKVVIDIEKKVLAGGAEKHEDEEKILLKIGSQQENLWGGGIDWETKEIDYNSMINLRPLQNNPSRDILATEIRTKFHAILTELLL